MVILGILLTLLILAIVVFVHEFWHFSLARYTGMRVEEFGFGIPPRAKKIFTDSKGTDYTLNWLPIWGFVRIKWEDPTAEDAHDEGSFSLKKWWARAAVLIAGVMMNFLLAWVIFTLLFAVWISPLAPNALIEKDYGSFLLPSMNEAVQNGYISYDHIMLSPVGDGPAQKAGILPWDHLVHIEGETLRSIEDFIAITKKNQPFHLIVSGTGWSRSLIVTPKNGKISAYLSYSGLTLSRDFVIHHPPWDAIIAGARETLALSLMTIDLLKSTLRKLFAPRDPQERVEAGKMVAGPIGMWAGMIDILRFWLTPSLFLLLVALLSINLGVINILPFPALDGWRLVSTTIVSLIGLFTEEKKSVILVERWIHIFGMIFLLAISLVIAFYDVIRL